MSTSTPPADAGGQMDMQMAAAALLANNKDVKMMLRVLGKNLQDAFGDRVEITHPSGGLFHRQSDEIKSITVHLDTTTTKQRWMGRPCVAVSGAAPGVSASVPSSFPSSNG